VSVPVSHEELRIEREPITDANRGAALSGGEITEQEHEIILHAEQPGLATDTVPVERVRIGTETVTGEQSVTGEVRKGADRGPRRHRRPGRPPPGTAAQLFVLA
jgi:stress response protein YsnF